MKHIDIDNNKIINLINDRYGCMSTDPLGIGPELVLSDELTNKPDKTLLQLAILLEKYGCKNLDELDGFIKSCVNRICYDKCKWRIYG